MDCSGSIEEGRLCGPGPSFIHFIHVPGEAEGEWHTMLARLYRLKHLRPSFSSLGSLSRPSLFLLLARTSKQSSVRAWLLSWPFMFCTISCQMNRCALLDPRALPRYSDTRPQTAPQKAFRKQHLQANMPRQRGSKLFSMADRSSFNMVDSAERKHESVSGHWEDLQTNSRFVQV